MHIRMFTRTFSSSPVHCYRFYTDLDKLWKWREPFMSRIFTDHIFKRAEVDVEQVAKELKEEKRLAKDKQRKEAALKESKH